MSKQKHLKDVANIQGSRIRTTMMSVDNLNRKPPTFSLEYLDSDYSLSSCPLTTEDAQVIAVLIDGLENWDNGLLHLSPMGHGVSVL